MNHDYPGPGAVPRVMMSETGTGAHYQQGGGSDGSGGPRTWQVIGGFLGAAAVIVAGTWTLAQTVFLSKETYLREQSQQASHNTELKSSIAENVKAVTRLESAVADLESTVAKLTQQLASDGRDRDRDRRSGR